MFPPSIFSTCTCEGFGRVLTCKVTKNIIGQSPVPWGTHRMRMGEYWSPFVPTCLGTSLEPDSTRKVSAMTPSSSFRSPNIYQLKPCGHACPQHEIQP